MPNSILPDAKRCTSLTLDGRPCGSPRIPGTPLCVYHNPESAARAQAKRDAGREAIVKPDMPLDDLLHLPLTSDASMRLLCEGLRQHLAARTIDYRQAQAILSIAREERTLHSASGTSTVELLRSVMAAPPPLPEPD